MEWSKRHSRETVPLGAGWQEWAIRFFSPLRVPKAGTSWRPERRSGKGAAAKPLAAKSCASGVLAYDLPSGVARSSKGAAALDRWHWAPFDVDKAGTTVADLLKIIQEVSRDTKVASYTTWSAQDGKASARLLFPLSRAATYDEICAIWWWMRARLEAAGLPDACYDGSAPALDPRLDARLFYLPAYPASQTVGDEGWGGVMPHGEISGDDVPVLDVDAVLPLARAAEAEDREAFAARWPGVPLPGGRGRAGGKATPSRSKSGPSKAEKSHAVRVDFTTVRFEGETLRSWADKHLPVSSEVSIGSPWRDDGGSGENGKSFRLHRYDDGSLGGTDFGTDTFYRDVSSTFEGDVYAPPTVKVKTSKEVEAGPSIDDLKSVHVDEIGRWVASLGLSDLTPEGWASDKAIKKVIARDGDRAAFPKGGFKTTILEIGQGRGKTELAARLCAEARAKGKRVVAVAPTRSLVSDCARRFGLADYRAVGEGPITASVAVCLPSLPRVINYELPAEGSSTQTFSFKTHGADLLVLDEIEQQVAALGGEHLADGEARSAWKALVEHVSLATEVLLLDANAGPLTRHLLEVAKRNPATTLWVRAPGAAPRRLEVMKRADQWRAALLKACETGRQAVACHSCAEAESLAKLAPLFQGLPSLVLTADSILKHGIDVSDLDKALPGYGHTFYSPAIGTGVSITLKGHFERVWGALCDSVGTAMSALQLLSRVRHPVDRTIAITRLGGGRTPSFWEKDATKVEAKWWRAEATTLRKIGFKRALPPAEIEVVGDGHQVCRKVRGYTSAMALAHASQVKAGLGQVTEALSVYCARLGWEVVEVDDEATEAEKAVRVAIKAAKEEVKVAEVAAIVQAEDLDEKAIDRVRRRGAKTYDESLGLRRASIDRVYGEGAADDDRIVAFDDRGKGRKAVYGYAQVCAAVEGGEALTSLERLDRVELRRAGSPIRLRHRVVRARGIANLVKRLVGASACGQIFAIDNTFTSPEDLPTSVRINEDRAQEVADLLTSQVGREMAALLGVSVGDATHSPMRLAGRVLEAAGLSMVGRKVQVDGVRGRVYEVDLEALAQVQDLSTHYLECLRSGDLGDLDEDEEADRKMAKSAQTYSESIVSDLDLFSRD